MEEVEGSVLRRVLRLAHGPAVAELTVEPDGVDLRLRGGDERDEAQAAAACRRLLDLDADPLSVDATLAADPLLETMVRASPGRRVPGAAEPFELAVRAVLGQQVAVAAARGLAARIVTGGGTPLEAPRGSLTHAFPGPAELLAAPAELFAMPAARRAALRAVAGAAAEEGDAALAPGRLAALPGIGPWTAAYVAMRAFGDRDAFPPGDAAVRTALRALGRAGDPRAAAAFAEAWRPYRAHAVMHLWDGPHSPPPKAVARA